MASATGFANTARASHLAEEHGDDAKVVLAVEQVADNETSSIRSRRRARFRSSRDGVVIPDDPAIGEGGDFESAESCQFGGPVGRG